MAFTGQLAVITGGGSGVGQTWARQLAADGVIVALLDVNTEGMEATASGFETIHTFEVDITDSGAVSAVFSTIETTLGPVDRVVNAAAIMPFGRLVDEDPRVTTGSPPPSNRAPTLWRWRARPALQSRRHCNT